MISYSKWRIRTSRIGMIEWRWVVPLLIVISSVLSWAEESMERVSPVPALDQTQPSDGSEWASMPEPEIQERLAEVRTEWIENRKEWHRLEFQLEQAGRSKELADEIKRIRRELGQLFEQSEQLPENAEQLAPQIQSLRRQVEEMEAERLGRLNQSEEYRALSARAGELQEQLKSILQALKQAHSEDSAGKTE